MSSRISVRSAIASKESAAAKQVGANRSSRAARILDVGMFKGVLLG